VFTADPRIVPGARRIPRISYEEMLEMAAGGAKVLHLRCVEYAKHSQMPIHVRSSFSSRDGTWVVGSASAAGTDSEESGMDQPIITGVAHDRSEATITVSGIPDKVGVAAKIFRTVANAAINIDMIVQSTSRSTGQADISFTLPRQDGQTAMTALRGVQDDIGYDSLVFDDRVGKISLIGAGMRSHPGVSADFFSALAESGINIRMISTSEIRISAIVDAADLDAAVIATHRAFGLEDGQSEAVVYGGTGR
jgi:aspartate kinase